MKRLEEAKRSLERITNTFENIKFLTKKSENLTNEEPPAAGGEGLGIRFNKLSEDFEKGFARSMDDDFNSARAIAFIFDYIRELNIDIGSPGFSIGPEIAKSLESAYQKINKLGLILGLDFEKELLRSSKDLFDETATSKEEILKLIKQRETDRENKDFSSADRIRGQLLEKGIILEDRKEGTVWKQKD
jgi:cysteinyl-tRNA synthetase